MPGLLGGHPGPVGPEALTLSAEAQGPGHTPNLQSRPLASAAAVGQRRVWEPPRGWGREWEEMTQTGRAGVLAPSPLTWSQPLRELVCLS